MSYLDRWKAIGFVALPDGAKLIGHVPHVAKLAYLHRVPPPLTDIELTQLESRLGKFLPVQLVEFYKCADGLSAFSDTLNVYGLRRSYQRSDLLAASAQPYDIGAPNSTERPSGLRFGEMVVGGYREDGSKILVDEGGAAYRCERGNALSRLNTWPSFQKWITSEIHRLGELFDETGHCLRPQQILPA